MRLYWGFFQVLTDTTDTTDNIGSLNTGNWSQKKSVYICEICEK